MEPLKINLSDYGVTLHLVRHGQDDRDHVGGWSDNHLTPYGIKQIQDLIPQIDDDYDIVVASDLIRTQETAQILNCKLNKKIILDPGFRETDNGIYKNMLKEDFKNQHLRKFTELDPDEKFGGGDSPISFGKRVTEAFIKLLENNRNKKILLVTHGGVITVILCLIKGIPYSNKLNLKPGTGTLIKL